MQRWLILIALCVSFVGLAQDSSDEDEAPVAADPAEEESTDDDALLEDDFELDDNTDHTEDDEDVFEASVEVSYQQSVPFPTDI